MQKDRFYFIVVIFLSSIFYVSANDVQDNENKMAFKGYSGGMMLHAGYAQSGLFSLYEDDEVIYTVRLRSAAFGIGGAMRVMFGNHLRVGLEGYATNSKLNKLGGYSSAGWGGILLDSKWEIKRWTVFCGGSFGGGGYKSVLIPDYNKYENNLKDFVIEDKVSYRSYPFIAVAPFVGMEYSITDRVHFVAKIDYLFSVSKHSQDFVTGPRLFLGFMFCHWK